MKIKLLFFLPALFITCLLRAQYKYDNTVYRTVFMEDLCNELNKNPNHILLDVRSNGEYSDTSMYANLNIGHLKDAVNIDIKQMNTRWKELLPYKDETIFVYCSHSQRSRRVSKMLTDSGFSNIVNINGGMTYFNREKNTLPECVQALYKTSHPYQLITPADLSNVLQKEKDVFILDVRSDSVFNGIDTNENLNAFGRLKNAVNIPAANVSASFNKIPQDKKIIIVDNYGNESPAAAINLLKNGYKNVYVLFNGMEEWAGTDEKVLPAKNKFWDSPLKDNIITPEEFDAAMRKQNNILIVDVRNADEFNNRSETSWRNRGNIKNAINIPAAELKQRLSEINDKNKEIIVYDMGGGADAYTAAKTLINAGYKKVLVLSGGLWDLRWDAANVKGLSGLNDWVINIPPDNI